MSHYNFEPSLKASYIHTAMLQIASAHYLASNPESNPINSKMSHRTQVLKIYSNT